MPVKKKLTPAAPDIALLKTAVVGHDHRIGALEGRVARLEDEFLESRKQFSDANDFIVEMLNRIDAKLDAHMTKES
jgi:hypothetical protein